MTALSPSSRQNSHIHSPRERSYTVKVGSQCPLAFQVCSSLNLYWWPSVFKALWENQVGIGDSPPPPPHLSKEELQLFSCSRYKPQRHLRCLSFIHMSHISHVEVLLTLIFSRIDLEYKVLTTLTSTTPVQTTTCHSDYCIVFLTGLLAFIPALHTLFSTKQ